MNLEGSSVQNNLGSLVWKFRIKNSSQDTKCILYLSKNLECFYVCETWNLIAKNWVNSLLDKNFKNLHKCCQFKQELVWGISLPLLGRSRAARSSSVFCFDKGGKIPPRWVVPVVCQWWRESFLPSLATLQIEMPHIVSPFKRQQIGSFSQRLCFFLFCLVCFSFSLKFIS